jgi:hypothetical protein
MRQRVGSTGESSRMVTRVRLKKTGYLFSTAVLTAGWSLSTLGQECPTTLAYLAPRLPRYNDANLEQMRNAVLESNIVEAMQRAQGTSSRSQQRRNVSVSSAQNLG